MQLVIIIETFDLINYENCKNNWRETEYNYAKNLSLKVTGKIILLS